MRPPGAALMSLGQRKEEDMISQNIDEAVAEAKRFLKRAKELKEIASKENWWHAKESGALRRASMDLTRALAKMRKS